MSLNSIKIGMSINNWGWSLRISEQKSNCLKDQSILENSLVAKEVIGRPLLSFIIHKLIAHSVYWESAINPSQEIIILDVFLWDFVIIVVLRWHFSCCILTRGMLLYILMRWPSTKGPLSLIHDLYNLSKRFWELTDDWFLPNLESIFY